MTEWAVFGVIITLVGFLAVLIKPIVSLTQAITKLTVTVDDLKQDVADIVKRNADSHARLWEKNKEQDGKINDHEVRIHTLEGK